MAEGGGLLNRYTGNTVSEVRLLSSPPDFSQSEKSHLLTNFDFHLGRHWGTGGLFYLRNPRRFLWPHCFSESPVQRMRHFVFMRKPS